MQGVRCRVQGVECEVQGVGCSLVLGTRRVPRLLTEPDDVCTGTGTITGVPRSSETAPL